MLKPAYKITIDDKVVDTTQDAQASTVTELRVSLDMDLPADQCRITLGQVDGFNPQREQQLIVELGYADEDALFKVFTGALIRVEPGLIHNQILGHSSTETLLHRFTDQTFENQSAGDIVNALSSQAEVTTASIEQGSQYPAYVIDGRRSFYRHMLALAELNGFDLYFNEDDELVFKRFNTAETIHLFDYAQHIIQLDFQFRLPASGSVEAYGESPAGEQSTEAWAWLTRDFNGSKGVAGNSEPVMLLANPVLRTAELAQTAAESAFNTIQQRSIQGSLLSTGRAGIRLGDAIRINDVPQSELNGSFKVTRVDHTITKADGFVTRVEFRSLSGAAA